MTGADNPSGEPGRADIPGLADTISVADGACVLGLDSFTIYSFIQRDRLTATRSPSGEIMIPETELARLAGRERSAAW